MARMSKSSERQIRWSHRGLPSILHVQVISRSCGRSAEHASPSVKIDLESTYANKDQGNELAPIKRENLQKRGPILLVEVVEANYLFNVNMRWKICITCSCHSLLLIVLF